MVRLVNIRQRIHGLHAGQVAILVLVGGIGVALLLQARRYEVAEMRRKEQLAARSLHDIDSLTSEIGQAQFWLRTIPAKERFNLLCTRQHLDCPNLDTLGMRSAKMGAEHVHKAAVADFKATADQIVGINVLITAIAGLSLGLLWVWFGGRQRP